VRGHLTPKRPEKQMPAYSAILITGSTSILTLGFLAITFDQNQKIFDLQFSRKMFGKLYFSPLKGDLK
jgi:hypothetical protein